MAPPANRSSGVSASQQRQQQQAPMDAAEYYGLYKTARTLARSYQAVAHQKDDQVKALTREMEELKIKIQQMEAEQKRYQQGSSAAGAGGNAQPPPSLSDPPAQPQLAAQSTAPTISNPPRISAASPQLAGTLNHTGPSQQPPAPRASTASAIAITARRSSELHSLFSATMLRHGGGGQTPDAQGQPAKPQGTAPRAARSARATDGSWSLRTSEADEAEDADNLDASKAKKGKGKIGQAFRKLLSSRSWRGRDDDGKHDTAGGAATDGGGSAAGDGPAVHGARRATVHGGGSMSSSPAFHQTLENACEDGVAPEFEAPRLPLDADLPMHPSAPGSFKPPAVGGGHSTLSVTLPSEYLLGAPTAQEQMAAAAAQRREAQRLLEAQRQEAQRREAQRIADAKRMEAQLLQEVQDAMPQSQRHPQQSLAAASAPGQHYGTAAPCHQRSTSHPGTGSASGPEVAVTARNISGTSLDASANALNRLRRLHQQQQPQPQPSSAPASGAIPLANSNTAPRPSNKPIASSEGGTTKWAMLVQRTGLGQVAAKLKASVPGVRSTTTAVIHRSYDSSLDGSTTSGPSAPTDAVRQSWSSSAVPQVQDHVADHNGERSGIPPASHRPPLASSLSSLNFRAVAAQLGSNLPPRPAGRVAATSHTSLLANLPPYAGINSSMVLTGSVAGSDCSQGGLEPPPPSSTSPAFAQSAPVPVLSTADHPSSTAGPPVNAVPYTNIYAAAAVATARPSSSSPTFHVEPPAISQSARVEPAFRVHSAGGSAPEAYLEGILGRLKTPSVLMTTGPGPQSVAASWDPSSQVTAPRGISQQIVVRNVTDASTEGGNNTVELVLRREMRRTVGVGWRHKALCRNAPPAASFHEKPLRATFTSSPTTRDAQQSQSGIMVETSLSVPSPSQAHQYHQPLTPVEFYDDHYGGMDMGPLPITSDSPFAANGYPATSSPVVVQSSRAMTPPRPSHGVGQTTMYSSPGVGQGTFFASPGSPDHAAYFVPPEQHKADVLWRSRSPRSRARGYTYEGSPSPASKSHGKAARLASEAAVDITVVVAVTASPTAGGAKHESPSAGDNNAAARTRRKTEQGQALDATRQKADQGVQVDEITTLKPEHQGNVTEASRQKVDLHDVEPEKAEPVTAGPIVGEVAPTGEAQESKMGAMWFASSAAAAGLVPGTSSGSGAGACRSRSHSRYASTAADGDSSSAPSTGRSDRSWSNRASPRAEAAAAATLAAAVAELAATAEPPSAVQSDVPISAGAVNTNLRKDVLRRANLYITTSDVPLHAALPSARAKDTTSGGAQRSTENAAADLLGQPIGEMPNTASERPRGKPEPKPSPLSDSSVGSWDPIPSNRTGHPTGPSSLRRTSAAGTADAALLTHGSGADGSVTATAAALRLQQNLMEAAVSPLAARKRSSVRRRSLAAGLDAADSGAPKNDRSRGPEDDRDAADVVAGLPVALGLQRRWKSHGGDESSAYESAATDRSSAGTALSATAGRTGAINVPGHSSSTRADTCSPTPRSGAPFASPGHVLSHRSPIAASRAAHGSAMPAGDMQPVGSARTPSRLRRGAQPAVVPAAPGSTLPAAAQPGLHSRPAAHVSGVSLEHRHRAASVIQAGWRALLAKRAAAAHRHQLQQQALLLQQAVRRQRAAVVIQAAWRGARTRSALQQELLALVIEETEWQRLVQAGRERAACLIQEAWRAYRSKPVPGDKQERTAKGSSDSALMSTPQVTAGAKRASATTPVLVLRPLSQHGAVCVKVPSARLCSTDEVMRRRLSNLNSSSIDGLERAFRLAAAGGAQFAGLRARISSTSSGEGIRNSPNLSEGNGPTSNAVATSRFAIPSLVLPSTDLDDDSSVTITTGRDEDGDLPTPSDDDPLPTPSEEPQMVWRAPRVARAADAPRCVSSEHLPQPVSSSQGRQPAVTQSMPALPSQQPASGTQSPAPAHPGAAEKSRLQSRGSSSPQKPVRGSTTSSSVSPTRPQQVTSSIARPAAPAAAEPSEAACADAKPQQRGLSVSWDGAEVPSDRRPPLAGVYLRKSDGSNNDSLRSFRADVALLAQLAAAAMDSCLAPSDMKPQPGTPQPSSVSHAAAQSEQATAPKAHRLDSLVSAPAPSPLAPTSAMRTSVVHVGPNPTSPSPSCAIDLLAPFTQPATSTSVSSVDDDDDEEEEEEEEEIVKDEEGRSDVSDIATELLEEDISSQRCDESSSFAATVGVETSMPVDPEVEMFRQQDMASGDSPVRWHTSQLWELVNQQPTAAAMAAYAHAEGKAAAMALGRRSWPCPRPAPLTTAPEPGPAEAPRGGTNVALANAGPWPQTVGSVGSQPSSTMGQIVGARPGLVSSDVLRVSVTASDLSDVPDVELLLEEDILAANAGAGQRREARNRGLESPRRDGDALAGLRGSTHLASPVRWHTSELWELVHQQPQGVTSMTSERFPLLTPRDTSGAGQNAARRSWPASGLGTGIAAPPQASTTVAPSCAEAPAAAAAQPAVAASSVASPKASVPAFSGFPVHGTGITASPSFGLLAPRQQQTRPAPPAQVVHAPVEVPAPPAPAPAPLPGLLPISGATVAALQLRPPTTNQPPPRLPSDSSSVSSHRPASAAEEREVASSCPNPVAATPESKPRMHRPTLSSDDATSAAFGSYDTGSSTVTFSMPTLEVTAATGASASLAAGMAAAVVGGAEMGAKGDLAAASRVPRRLTSSPSITGNRISTPNGDVAESGECSPRLGLPPPDVYPHGTWQRSAGSAPFTQPVPFSLPMGNIFEAANLRTQAAAPTAVVGAVPAMQQRQQPPPQQLGLAGGGGNMAVALRERQPAAVLAGSNRQNSLNGSGDYVLGDLKGLSLGSELGGRSKARSQAPPAPQGRPFLGAGDQQEDVLRVYDGLQVVYGSDSEY